MDATVVQTYEDVAESVKAFNKGLEEGNDLSDQLSYFRAWYYIPDLDAVGPSKFIGYKGMTAKEYKSRYNKDLDGRVTVHTLARWFKYLEGSPEEKYAAAKVEQLLQRYNKKPSRAFWCGVPPAWRLGKNDSPLQQDGRQTKISTGEAERPIVEVFWRAFLSLYPEDQEVLAKRVLGYKRA